MDSIIWTDGKKLMNKIQNCNDDHHALALSSFVLTNHIKSNVENKLKSAFREAKTK